MLVKDLRNIGVPIPTGIVDQIENLRVLATPVVQENFESVLENERLRAQELAQSDLVATLA